MSEAYQNGLSAHPLDMLPTLPMWAKVLRCNFGSIWVYTDINSFLMACGTIEQISKVRGTVSLELVPFNDGMEAYSQYLRDLESKCLNLAPYAATVSLEGFGATFHSTFKGHASLSGLFKLTMTFDDHPNPITYQTQGVLKFPLQPHNYVPIGSKPFVGYFKVPAKVTMDAFEARSGVVHQLDFAEQFPVFFDEQETQRPKLSTRWSFWKH